MRVFRLARPAVRKCHVIGLLRGADPAVATDDPAGLQREHTGLTIGLNSSFPPLDIREGGDWLPSRYEPSRRPRWVLFGLIALIHAVGFVALRYLDPEIVRRARTVPLVVDLLPNTPVPPEPRTAELPTRQEVAPRPTPQRIVAPAPIVETPTIPVIVAASPPVEPNPPAPVKSDEERPAPRRTGETTVDLDTKLLSAEPPRYPVESRRRRETGTVVLLVVVNEDGRVAAISIATSSGVDRLDKAALVAVRRWRWSPTVIDGTPSQVRGFVRIPFELKSI